MGTQPVIQGLYYFQRYFGLKPLDALRHFGLITKVVTLADQIFGRTLQKILGYTVLVFVELFMKRVAFYHFVMLMEG